MLQKGNDDNKKSCLPKTIPTSSWYTSPELEHATHSVTEAPSARALLFSSFCLMLMTCWTVRWKSRCSLSPSICTCNQSVNNQWVDLITIVRSLQNTGANLNERWYLPNENVRNTLLCHVVCGKVEGMPCSYNALWRRSGVLLHVHCDKVSDVLTDMLCVALFTLEAVRSLLDL